MSSSSAPLHLRAAGAHIPADVNVGACFVSAGFVPAEKLAYPTTADPTAVTCQRCLRLMAKAPPPAPDPAAQVLATLRTLRVQVAALPALYHSNILLRVLDLASAILRSGQETKP